MVVIKRDGREVNFDKSKIRDAAYRALCEVDHLHPIENKENLAERVANRPAAILSIITLKEFWMFATGHFNINLFASLNIFKVFNLSIGVPRVMKGVN